MSKHIDIVTRRSAIRSMDVNVTPKTSAADPAITEAIADFALSGSFACLLRRVQRESARTVVNWVGCALGGAPTPTIEAAIKGLQSYLLTGTLPRDRTARTFRCARRRCDQLPRLGSACVSTTPISRPSRIRPDR